jgi:hypothetical protein
VAVREVSEEEFLATQNVVRAVNGMLANPQARKILLQARKIADPNVPIPEIDAAAPIEAGLSAIRQEIAAERQARAEEQKAEREALAALKAEREAEKEAAKQERLIAKFKADWEAQKSALRAAGWRDEGIAEIERHAEAKGIADLEIAAAHWEKLHPPPEVAQSSGAGSWGFMEGIPDDDKFIKAMIESHGDDERALDAEIAASLRDFRQQQAQGSRR